MPVKDNPQRCLVLRWLALLAAVLTLALALPCRAQAAGEPVPDTQKRNEASARYQRGHQLYEEGNFRAALIEFRTAHELVPNWTVLFNIGQVQFQLQDYAGALASLERYLAQGGTAVPEDRRKTVEADIVQLRGRVAQLTITVSVAGAEVTIDDVSIGTTPLPDPIAVSTGRRKVTITKAGHAPMTKSVDMAGGASAEVGFILVQTTPSQPQSTGPITPSPPPPPAPDRPGTSSHPGIAWAVSASLAAGAVAFGLLALNAASSLDEAKGRSTSKDELEDDRSRALGFGIATDVMIGGAVVAGGVALYLTIWGDDPADADGVASRAELVVTPDGVALAGSF